MMTPLPCHRPARPPGAARRFGGLLLGLALLALATGCEDSGPVRIGFSGPLTGPWSDLGVQGRNGATLAVEDVNARGGIAGRPVALLAADEKDSPEAAAEAVRELDRQGATVLVGLMTSAAAQGGLPAAEAAGLAVVSPTASTPGLTGRDDAFFRVVQDLDAFARAQARRMAEKDNLRRVLVVLDQGNAAYAESYARTFTAAFAELGGEVADTARAASGHAPDGATLARRAREGEATALLAVLSARDLARLARELRPAAPDLALYSSIWGFTAEFLEMAGQAAEGVGSCVTYPFDDFSPAVASFNARYRERFGQAASFGAALAYEAVQTAALALGRTGGHRAGAVQALAGLGPIPGVLGDIVFDRYGDVSRPVFCSRVEGGRIRTLEAEGD